MNEVSGKEVKRITDDVVEYEGERYEKFNQARLRLNCRFQQVYQRAVVRNKMRWIELGKAKYVRVEDVDEWLKYRKEHNYVG